MGYTHLTAEHTVIIHVMSHECRDAAVIVGGAGLILKSAHLTCARKSAQCKCAITGPGAAVLEAVVFQWDNRDVRWFSGWLGRPWAVWNSLLTG